MSKGEWILTIIYPNNPKFDDESESFLYSYFKKHLPEGYVCYFHYNAQVKEFDVAVLVPNHGIAIIEIKGWTDKSLVRVVDNNDIRIGNLSNSDSKFSPLKQARDYVFLMMKKLIQQRQLRIFVVPMVCYPFISQHTYDEKQLNIVSEPVQTLLKDDFDQHRVIGKIENLFTFYPSSNIQPFNKENMMKVRTLFETKDQIEMSNQIVGETIVKHQELHYSWLQYISANIKEEELNTMVTDMVNQWVQGTKIITLSESNDVLNKIRATVMNKTSELLLNQRKDFTFVDKEGNYKSSIYRFSLHKLKSPSTVPVKIINGVDADKYESVLAIFDKDSDFNMSQYLIEHHKTKEHIQIKAGAGTGKTFSMISRIHYLIYSHGITADQLKDFIVLITFTREAAHNMKRRLQGSFQNYFLLTKNFEFFRMIEKIEDLRISTIHSLSKRILQRYAAKFGLSKDIRITNGSFDRKKYFNDAINEILTPYFEKNSSELEEIKLTMHNLGKRVYGLFSKLNSKNIDVLHDLNSEHFGTSRYLPLLHQVVQKSIMNGEKAAQDYFEENNVVPLSELMIKLKYLKRSGAFNGFTLENKDTEHMYVFVDEFQDTDNVQIELLKEFQIVLDFSFFVVGDLKQCIYRFRGAEDQAFKELLGEVEEVEWGKTFALTKNYRSDHLLLNQFEEIFQEWGNRDDKLLEYKADVDCLTSHIHINDGKFPNDYFKTILLNNYTDFTEFDSVFKAELQKQYELLDDEKDEELAILVRYNREVEHIRKLGEELGLFIETDTGGRLFQIESTIDFYKLIIALKKPDNLVNLLNLYTTSYSEAYIPKAAIADYKKDPIKLSEFIKKSPPIPNFEIYVKELKLMPVLSVLQKLINDLRPWDAYVNEKKSITIPDQREKFRYYYKHNLDQLLEKIIKIGDGDYLTLNKIEQYLRLMIVTGQQEESRENIRMEQQSKGRKIVCKTVHKSKGLEYRTVMLPFMNTNLENSNIYAPIDVIVSNNNNVGYRIRLDDKIVGKWPDPYYFENNHYTTETSKEILSRKREEARILYVGLTRAIESVIMFCDDNNTQEGLTWQNLIRNEVI